MLVTTDKEGFVVKAEWESHEKPMATATPATQECKGPFHNKGKGVGTPLPLAEFAIVNGNRLLTCNRCRTSNTESRRKMMESRNGVNKIEHALAAAHIEPEVPGSDFQHGVVVGELLPIWKVTIIQRTIVEVRAKDFLDAASQAGDGEVLKVERID